MPIHPSIAGTPAEIYEQHMVPAIFIHWAPDLVEAAGVQPGGRALDVACGTGVVTRQYRKSHPVPVAWSADHC